MRKKTYKHPYLFSIGILVHKQLEALEVPGVLGMYVHVYYCPFPLMFLAKH